MFENCGILAFLKCLNKLFVRRVFQQAVAFCHPLIAQPLRIEFEEAVYHIT